MLSCSRSSLVPLPGAAKERHELFLGVGGAIWCSTHFGGCWCLHIVHIGVLHPRREVRELIRKVQGEKVSSVCLVSSVCVETLRASATTTQSTQGAQTPPVRGGLLLVTCLVPSNLLGIRLARLISIVSSCSDKQVTKLVALTVRLRRFRLGRGRRLRGRAGAASSGTGAAGPPPPQTRTRPPPRTFHV